MRAELAITGMGVIAAVGQGQSSFLRALLRGDHAFSVMRRSGRQKESSFLGAEIGDIAAAQTLPKKALRSASLSAQAALVVMREAWDDAHLSELDPARIGLVVGGSNFQQRELTLVHDEYADRSQFLRPTYALSFMDSDLCGFCTEQFSIRGPAHTLGGASASGQLAIIQAAQAVLTNEIDACIALGALMDLSYWECRAFHALGAMGSDRFADAPELACRPFDRDRDGFVFGESCGAVVVESAKSSQRRRANRYAKVAGWGITTDGNRNPDPSLDGEVRAIESALRSAGWSSSEIDYINPHGSGSVVGDETELQAIRDCRLTHAYLNTTKSIVGHGLCAAGAVEVVATVLQMQAGQLHPSRNLIHPIDPTLNWVTTQAVDYRIQKAITLSVGFGGINTALCLERYA